MLKKFGLMICLLFLAACDRAEPFAVDQHGAVIAESALNEQWLVINYWAVWCAPCRKEIPELNALHHDLADQGVRVFGVNFDQLQGEDLLADSEELGIEFPVLSHDPAERFNLSTARGLPATYIINAKGEFVRLLQGEQTAQTVLAVLQEEGWSAP
ncbi:MAG: TlpA family protein disulfide reductase [Gammaproteobacteria bacterium]|nr:TlpA family protein disulfide reductase [Gammaproteobacteria bacterium]